MRNTMHDLNGRWQLAHFDGYGQELGDPALPGALPNLCWIEAEVPGSVYRDLMRAGWLPDIYSGCNTLAARWVEQEYWYYRRMIEKPAAAPADASGARCFLVLDGLDLDAVVYLDGQVLAEHHNVFRPLRIDVTDRLTGTHELIVRLGSGLLGATDRRGGDYNLELTAAATKRAWLRKPQFGCRWDWAPRLMNVGIGGGVWLEVCPAGRLAALVVTPELEPDHRRARLHVRAVVENVTDRPRGFALRCRLGAEGDGGATGASEAAAELPPGVGELRCTLTLDNPQLWWLHSLGEPQRRAPRLYDVETALLVDGVEVEVGRQQTGVRSVALCQDPAPGGGRLFQLVINGEPVFCKGANWVPADVLWPTVTAGDYEQLVGLAVECGCNLLRVWGGGHYAHPAFLAACDRAGVLVWHDLLFACSKYPGDDPGFAEEVAAEVRHNVRALASHPSLVLWCGNNEVTLGIRDGWIRSYDPAARPCDELFFKTLARIVGEEDGSRPYWPTSPWSPDGSHPNDPFVGDQHPWLVSLGPARGDYWLYRQDPSRFANEGGMLGPSTPKTLRQILPAAERRIGSRTWLHHDNTQNVWRGEPLLDNLLRTHLSGRPRDLPFDEYVRYAGILHGEALETAIDNWRRRKFHSAAAVFWMFNDTWPATVSWTPIDFHRRRKPAFWYVKRAFAPLRAIAVELGRDVAFFVVNDTLEPRRVRLNYGLFALAGGRPVDDTIELECPANSAAIAARLPLREWDRLGARTHGAFAVLHAENGTALSTQRLFRARFGELVWPSAAVRIESSGDAVRVWCDTFAWAVCLDEEGETPLADNWFDLLPGVAHVVPWPAGRPLPVPQAANPRVSASRAGETLPG